MKIEVKRDLCIGAANCIAVAPDAFELDSENKAVLRKEWEKTAGDILLESAKSCPTQAIFVYDDENKQIFP